jgi:hypothetical protein
MKSNHSLKFFKSISIFLVFLCFLLSCNNEEEALFESNDTTDENTNVLGEDIGENIIVDDRFIITSGNVKEFDVLSNDDLSEFTNVVITSISEPIYGDINITGNNLFEYSAPDISLEIADNFTYTVEATKSDGRKILLDGAVTVEVVAQNYLFTPESKIELKNRFENGYVTGPGFTNDISRAIANKDAFMTNPSHERSRFGEDFYLRAARQGLHHAAIWAYAYDDVNVANTVVNELLETVKSNDLSTTWWKSRPNFAEHASLWEQSATIGKMKKSYYLIRVLQTSLTNEELKIIENFFSDFAYYVKIWVDNHFDKYWGNDWENKGLTSFHGENLFPETALSVTSYPIEHADGTPNLDYVIAGAQNNFNNRTVEAIAYLHSWSITSNDRVYEHKTREWFKNCIRYALWSDGSFFELMRNKNVYNINELGVWYSFSTLSALVNMAHIDALANHFPDDKLYDFNTTDGLIKGSTNLTNKGYVGGSTTDGVTLKSLKTFIIGQSKYYRSSEYGGWNDIRYYGGEPLDMTGSEERDYSIPQAVANLYYKDPDLKDFYSYNTAKGYPTKNSYKDGAYHGEDGSIGQFLLGGAWFEQENNFFN